MSERELHLLSPYRLPTSYPLQLANDEASAWLNGHAALWHPAALALAGKLPQVSNSYDHDSPRDGFIYAVPQGPSLFQPDDWPARVDAVDAIAFAATANRRETITNLLDALREKNLSGPWLDLDEETVRPFLGLGLAYLLVESLYDAMEHEHLLDVEAFGAEVRHAAQAAPEVSLRDDMLGHLKAAAEILLQAREQLHSSSIFWLDWCFLDEANLTLPWPDSLAHKIPLTIVGSVKVLERLASEALQRWEELKAQAQADAPGNVTLCCGADCEREDALMPLESQWWNLRQARRRCQELLGVSASVYGRMKSAYHPQLPSWLQATGYEQAVMLSLDGALLPSLRTTAIHWPGPDGKAIDTFVREPLPAHDPHTFFNLVYHLHQSITQDPTPTIALGHRGKPPDEAYRDLLALAPLGPVLGEWVSLGRYFREAFSGEYVGVQNADDFFADYLDDRVSNHRRTNPVSGFARQARWRRRIDSTFTLAALFRSLTPGPPSAEEQDQINALAALEEEGERLGVDLPLEDNSPPTGADAVGSPVPADAGTVPSGPSLEERLTAIETATAQRLAQRLLVRATAPTPGLMLLNPCNFPRRVALEVDGFDGMIAVDGPVKAAEFDGSLARLVVEVPPLGFSWLPRRGNASAPKPRLKLASEYTVRNEFFEADIDPTSGGLRAFRDLRQRTNRFGQYLVYNPGSRIQLEHIAITHNGPALGEITTQGQLLSEQDEPLARFRQRFRAWAGRPVLEIKIELTTRHMPTGYPWHAYYGARFGWRDERAVLFRAVNGQNTQTGYTRPVSPDYLEVRIGAERSFLFTGGLPFLQRHGSRMVDVILRPEGEQESTFELLLSLEREHPMQTAQGWITPVLVVPVDRGPPHVGSTGWLAHVDMPNLLLTTLRPHPAREGMDRAVIAHLAECSGFGGTADVRFAREPTQAWLVDGMWQPLQPLSRSEDAVMVDYSANEVVRLLVEWGEGK